MKQPVVYTEAEFLSFYEKLRKTDDKLVKAIGKFTVRDPKVVKDVKELIWRDGFDKDVDNMFDIRFDEENIKVFYQLELPNVTVFYQIKLIIIDNETTKNISKDTYICGMIKNGKESKKFEVKQILAEKETVK